MQASNAPSKSPVPFAESGTKNTIPVSSQIGVTPGLASFTDGFPPLTMTPLAAGGIPPRGADFNGILNFLSTAVRWGQAGTGYTYDAAFSTAIGGYPKGSMLRWSTGNGYWLSLVDNNTSNPDAGGANWSAFAPGLSAAGMKAVQSSQTLAIADLGSTVILNALTGSLTVTLPPAASAFRGARFEFINNGAIGASIVKQGSDNVLNTDGSLAAAGASVPVGAFLTLECVDSATWMIVNASPASASTTTAGVLRISSTLQAQQMADDGVAITPKKLKDAFLGGNQQLTTLGFQKIPGGTIEQWLRVPHTLGMGVSQAYTFPFAFPNATLGVSIVDISAPSSGAVVWAASQITASGLSMFWNYSNVTGGTSSREVFVRAIGW